MVPREIRGPRRFDTTPDLRAEARREYEQGNE